jgi:hypothetical protein
MIANVTTTDVLVSCLIGAVLFAIASAAWCLLESRREAAGDRQVRRNFEASMSAVELPPWNGEEYELAPQDAWDGSTYEWTPESLAYMNDTNLYAGPDVADTASFAAVPDVPPSDISGPLPVQDTGSEYDPAADAQAYLTAMRREHNQYMARLLEESR